jgi:HSP20 family protein
MDEFINTNWNVNSMRHSNLNPAVNIKESDKSYCLDIAAPGLNKDNIEVSYENKILSIEVVNSNKDLNTEYNRFEFDYNSFKRSFKLPDSIELSKIDASYLNGVLSISLPKKKEAQTQPKKLIKIK